MGRDLGGVRGTVVDFIEGIFEFAEEDGMATAQFSLDVWEDAGEIIDSLECLWHC